MRKYSVCCGTDVVTKPIVSLLKPHHAVKRLRDNLIQREIPYCYWELCFMPKLSHVTRFCKLINRRCIKQSIRVLTQ